MSEILLCAVQLRRGARDVNLQDYTLTGCVHIDASSVSCLKRLYEDNRITDLVVAGRAVPLSDLGSVFGCHASFEMAVPHASSVGYFVESIDQLLARPEHCVRMPEYGYALDLDCLWPTEKHDLFDRYSEAAVFVALLHRLADFTANDQMSFVAPERLDIPIRYSQSDLQSGRLESVSKLLVELNVDNPDQHTERRKEIFIGAVAAVLRGVDKEHRLGALIRHLDEVYARYRRDYDLYAREFTFAKLSAEFSKQKTDYVKKLNDVVKDISTKLLTIPLAYVLIAGQLVPGEAVKNHIIIIGAACFVLIMLILIFGQMLSLWHIRQEIAELGSNYRSRLPDVNKPLAQLNAKWWFQAFILMFVATVSVTVFFMALYLYRNYTSPDLIDLFGQFSPSVL